MSENTELHPITEKGRITRRQFLKWGAAAAGVTILASGEIEKVAISYITQFLANPQSGEKAFKFIADRLGNETGNPNFRPIDAIVTEGIETFERQTGKKAKFQRSTDYRDFSYYREQIEEAKKSIGILPDDPRKLIQLLIDSFPPAAKSAYLKSEVDIIDYLNIPSGSGMYDRFNYEYPPKDADNPSLVGRTDQFKQKVKEYIMEAKKFIEGEVQRTNKPISASYPFAFFLGKNEGDITQSLIDTYVFLKLAARNNLESGDRDYSSDSSNIEWIKTHILDEYGSESYNRKDTDSLNLIGKPYHSWNLVAMLTYFPVEIIQMGGVDKQLRHLDQQGITKLHSDIITLSELKSTESRLLKYQGAL